MKKLFKLPNFRSYEEFLSSSWLAIRVATLTVGVIAFQSLKVIQAFSLYEGVAAVIHSAFWTGITAFAILHFTVKISKIAKKAKDDKKMKKLLGRLIILFSFIEFLLGVGYHILWFNQEAGLDTFTIPPITPAFIFTCFLDLLLPVTLYFYGHTVHIKTVAEEELLNQDSKPDLEVGKTIVVDVPGFGTKELEIKDIK